MFRIESAIPGLGSLGGSIIVPDESRMDELHQALLSKQQYDKKKGIDKKAKTGKSGGIIQNHQYTPSTRITRKSPPHSPATPKMISNASKKSSNYRSRPNGGNK